MYSLLESCKLNNLNFGGGALSFSVEDKDAIRKCIQDKGGIKEIAKKRGVRFAALL